MQIVEKQKPLFRITYRRYCSCDHTNWSDW